MPHRFKKIKRKKQIKNKTEKAKCLSHKIKNISSCHFADRFLSIPRSPIINNLKITTQFCYLYLYEVFLYNSILIQKHIFSLSLITNLILKCKTSFPERYCYSLFDHIFYLCLLNIFGSHSVLYFYHRLDLSNLTHSRAWFYSKTQCYKCAKKHKVIFFSKKENVRQRR